MKKTGTTILAGCMALAFASFAHSATVFDNSIASAAAFNWSTGADGNYLTADDLSNQWGQVDLRNGGTAAVSKDFARSGNGSLMLAANGGVNAKAGVAYYPGTIEGFGTLSDISAASFDWMRASGSAATDGSPVMRLYLFEPGTNNHRATLLWTAANDGVAITNDAWQSTNVLAGKVWDTKVASAPITTFAAMQADPAYASLTVRAVEVGFGSGGWGPGFVGAVDNVRLTGSVASVDANFEASSVVLTMNTGANGSASMSNGPHAVDVGSAMPITLTPSAGYVVDQVSGCNGTLQGNVYTTGAFSVDCTVSATFKPAPVVQPPVVVDPYDARAVPTLGQWGLALLGMLTAGIAALRLRRRD